MAKKYDLLVIGAGSGGLAAAKQAAKYGAKVAIVEREKIGGVCVNQGCIPKKLMVYASDFAQQLRDAQGYGWTLSSPQFHWSEFVARRDEEIKRLQQVHTRSLQELEVDIIEGFATLTNPHTVKVDDRSYQADYILLAVGGKPNKPKIPGIEHCITSREIFHLAQLPDRIAIIGAGYIGVEFASMLQRWGAEVTLMNRESCILPAFDCSLRAAVRQGLSERGIQSLCNTSAAEICSTPDGLQVKLTGDHSHTLTVDTVLCATGRSINLEGLGLEQAGVEQEGKAIGVDDFSRTSQPHIFAVGDCTNRLPLTPVAVAEGRAFADTVFGQQPRCVDYRYIASAVFARPEAATVGLTEEQAIEQYGADQIHCWTTEFQPLFNSLGHSEEATFFKLVFENSSDRIVGVHLVGHNSAEIIQGFALAMKRGATRQDLHDMVGVHPSTAEELLG